ncbi:maleylpyruvate isomerase family mycothiol-dependent enzyme [Gordonia sp. NPDC003425]
MPHTHIDKAAITDALRAQWAALRTLAGDLTEAQWSAPAVLSGWSNADVIAHVVGTESMLAGRRPQAADISGRSHVRNPIGELNEGWVEHFRDRPRADVLAAFDEIVGVRTAALEAMSDEEFDAEAMTPAGPDTYGRFMRIRVFDCWMHELDLRDGVAVAPPSDPVTAGWAFDEIEASLPFVVGKRAGVPSGRRVLIELTGPGGRTVRIAVDQRAAAVEEFPDGDASADVSLRADTAVFARLAGGRRDADPGAVRIDGDEALGKSILDRLDYVI